MSHVPSSGARAATTLGLLLAAPALSFAADAAAPAAPAAPATPVVVAMADATPPAQQVNVTALRMPVRLADSVADVTVVTREDLDHATGRTLAEVLATLPGVEITSNGGPGTATGVFLRGLEARHTLLLVDGVRLDSATLGLPSFDNLPVALIDRIEVVRGPLSSIYGADAAGGVVQVFTRRGSHGSEFHADLTAGSIGTRGVLAGGSWGADGVDLAVDGSHQQDTGFSATNANVPFSQYNPDRDGFRQDAASARLGWQANADWRVEGLLLRSSGLVHYDDGLPDPGADGDARARLVNGVQSLSVLGRVMPGWRTTLRVSRSTDDYETVASASPYATLGTISTQEKRVSWENAVDTPVGTALAVAEKATQDVSKPAPQYDVDHRDIDALALALHGGAAGHTWQASVRRDHNSQFGSPTTGGVGYAYAFTPAWQAGGSWGTSFVAPSFNQLYFPQYGNPLLQPESGHSTEVFARWTQDGQSLRLSGYRQRLRGYITPGEDPVNIGRVAVDGVTLAYEGRWQDGTASLSADHLSPRDQTHGTPLVRRARNDAKASVDWDFGAYTAGATFTAYSSRPDTSYDAMFNAVPVTLGGYATLDVRADWKLAKDWTLGLRVNNLGDRRYETAYGYDQPRRQGFLVLSYRSR